MDALTITAGGLSGGISASISGGNFWDGARQGLITSGLNHVMHSTMRNNQSQKNCPTCPPDPKKKSLGDYMQSIMDEIDQWEFYTDGEFIVLQGPQFAAKFEIAGVGIGFDFSYASENGEPGGYKVPTRKNIGVEIGPFGGNSTVKSANMLGLLEESTTVNLFFVEYTNGTDYRNNNNYQKISIPFRFRAGIHPIGVDLGIEFGIIKKTK